MIIVFLCILLFVLSAYYLYETSFECEMVEMKSNTLPIKIFDQNFAIPRIIFQTSEWTKVPKGMSYAINSWINLNPEFEHRYFTGKDCELFIEKLENGLPGITDAYKTLIPGAYKADLFRYCVLYYFGGVYVDSAMIDIVPLSKILEKYDFINKHVFISAVDDGLEGGIYNAFMASTPFNPILKRTIELSIKRIKARDYKDGFFGITGPICLGDAVSDILNIKPRVDFKEGEYLLKDGIIKLFMRKTPKDFIEKFLHIEKIGFIYDFENIIIKTKYETFKQEDKCWRKQEHYAKLFEKQKVFID